MTQLEDLTFGDSYRFVRDTHDWTVHFRPGTVVTYVGQDGDDPMFTAEGYDFQQSIHPGDLELLNAADLRLLLEHQHVWETSRDGYLNGKPAFVSYCGNPACGVTTPRHTK